MAREQTAYKLPPKLLAEFRTETKRAGVTMTSVVEESVRSWITRQKANRKLARAAKRELSRLATR